MKILFLDQSGKLGGAELSLADVASAYRESCLVGLFADGPFRELLERQQIPVKTLTQQSIQVRKDSNIFQSLGSVGSLLPLVMKVANLAREYDLIYANTQKALVVGAIASLLSRCPLVYHLRDILSDEHFSSTNRRVAVTLANRFARLVIANSKATQTAFITAGGRSDISTVVYNGFMPEDYQISKERSQQTRQELGFDQHFVVGHFSRLSPWKGQHVLLEALASCPDDVAAIFVGDALFGEQDYAQSLRQQVAALGLEGRVKFLGFRSDVIPLMAACNLIAHTSTAPEPFGRVIVEAMLCERPVVAAEAGGAIELVEHGKTGWLCSPGNAKALADIISCCKTMPEAAIAIAKEAKAHASQQFDLMTTNHQLASLIEQCLKAETSLK
ncbi:glycosyltransferase [Oscillatoria sp. FACHB-1407]|uniref:glycosyltransferase n=1 Tax=Oscillatoria sp. FACHB-1407 TaxID=2692847 RepID=UPI0016845F31|nr:glycosyltransferase [Oscillatoria sp. FACHB-1407]MBD2459709.1 glycosyltransferase [Oscillatoria sp. FACHB-1407]